MFILIQCYCLFSHYSYFTTYSHILGILLRGIQHRVDSSINTIHFSLRSHHGLMAFRSLPSTYYYQVSNASERQIPILMDSFTYCENNHFHLDAVFNLKYLSSDKQQFLNNPISASFHGETVDNSIGRDHHKHVILSSFVFNSSCSSRDSEFSIKIPNVTDSYVFVAPYAPKPEQPMYYLSMCTSISSVPLSLVRSWMEYHLANGIEHITIYANDMHSYWKDQLHEYIEIGVLSLLEFSYIHHLSFLEQQVALSSCNRRYRRVSKFVIFNDVDEFFMPINPEMRVIDVVKQYDQLYPNADSFQVNSAFVACRQWDFNNTLDIESICNKVGPIITTMRQKMIVNPLRVPFVQVHMVTGASMIKVNYTTDMFFVHWKRKVSVQAVNEYRINESVKKRLNESSL